MSGVRHDLLPIVDREALSKPMRGPGRFFWNTVIHTGRVLLLVLLIFLIRSQAEQIKSRAQAKDLTARYLPVVQKFWPEAQRLVPRGQAEQISEGGLPRRNSQKFDQLVDFVVLGAQSEPVGFVTQTTPASDRYLGFSGPTNVLVGWDVEGKVAWAEIADSRDTRDHVELIVRDGKFLAQWNGKGFQTVSEDIVDQSAMRHVAGATLTCLAILQGLEARLNSQQVVAARPADSTRFPLAVTIEDVQKLFPQASRFEPHSETSLLLDVFAADGRRLGQIFRTVPAADQLIGYQGPTEVLVSLLPDGHLGQLLVGRSFDNEPYVGYVRDDAWFAELIKGKTVKGLAETTFEEWGVEGVSGATMTSQTIVRGLLAAAIELSKEIEAQQKQPSIDSKNQETGLFVWIKTINWSSPRLWQQTLTALVVILACLVGLTHLRGNLWLRRGLQLLVLGYLGVMNGELLSLAMFSGWAQSGIPWNSAGGLIAMSFAAVALPLVARTNVYCSHICPHGVLQQWMAGHRHWRPRLPARVVSVLRLVIPALLLVVLCGSMGVLSISLVDLEPFDAYSWRAAGWITTVLAVGSLVISWFIPMGYCRFGCPTGSLLEYLRRNARSGQIQPGDFLAMACLIIAGGLMLWDVVGP